MMPIGRLTGSIFTTPVMSDVDRADGGCVIAGAERNSALVPISQFTFRSGGRATRFGGGLRSASRNVLLWGPLSSEDLA